VVSAIAQNGTAPYLYQITTSPAAPAPTDPFWASTSTFNVNAGNYYVHAMDAYRCIISSPVQVVPMDASPVIAGNTTNQCTVDEGQFEIEITLVTAGTPPYSFSIDGGAFQTRTMPFTISNLSSGTHTIEMNDTHGCGNLVTVAIEPPIGLTPVVTALPSCNDNDGEITVVATGGTANYAYSINPNPPSIILTGNVFSGVPSGTYTITVTDTVTTCFEDVSVTLENATPVTFNTEVTNVSCNGDIDGTITIELLQGNNNPIYTYEITAPIVVPAQNSNIFTGLSANTYSLLVTSGRGCIAIADVTINEPQLLEVTADATLFSCTSNNTTSSAIITISEVGGTAPYSYSIDGTNYFNSNTFEVLDTGATQTVTVYVKDTNACIATNTIILEPLPTITAAAVSIGTPIDCNETGTITINVTGGSGNFTYKLLPDGTPQTSNIFDISGPGTYYFQVDDLDTDCYFLTLPFVVAPFDEIDAILIPTEANDCFGDTNGELQLTINGYSGIYTYQLYDGTGVPIGDPISTNTSTNPQLITGLGSGNYSVMIVEIETPFCTTLSNVVTIGSPSIPLVLVLSETSNVTCSNSQGTITAIATGGTNPYEYELIGNTSVPYSSNNTFSDLSAGNYIVNTRDANGCIETDTITLIEPTPIEADFVPNTTLLACFGDQNASITVLNVIGGQVGNYTYTLITILPVSSTSGPQTSNVFEELGAGQYSVIITDGYGCMLTSLPITINQPEPIISSLVATTTPTCLTDASLTLSATGGTGIYEYSETADFSLVLGAFSNSVTFTVSQGTYDYFVRDANGCFTNVSNEITIDPLPVLELNLASTNPEINCEGDNTGVIEATAQGGLGNYVYILQDTSGNTIPAEQNSPGIFTGLTAGIYVVYVESGDCAITSDEINITEPDTSLEVTFNVSNIICAGEDNGSLEIIATGGTGIILYAISPRLDQFFETNIFENLAPGFYDVIVQDELGCFITFNFEVTELPQVLLSIIPDSTIPEICQGDEDGSFSIEIEGGTPPYSVSLDDYNGEYITGELDQTEFEFTELGGGSHTVYVRDSLGCESEWVIAFPDSVLINPLVELEYQCMDNVTHNIVTVTVDESIIDTSLLLYSLNDSPYQASNVFIDLPPSENNFISVLHANGCVQITDFFDIGSFTPLSLILSNGAVNEIVATATGGTGDYQYTLNDVDYGSTNTFTITESGTFTVTVTDSSGCIVSATIILEFIEICIPNYFTPNEDGVSDYWAPGCADSYPNLVFSIFDRYGRRVAMLRQGQKWDGRYNSTELPTGDYWYIVRLGSENNHEFVGHFTLYR